jgi:hypothetical protein
MLFMQRNSQTSRLLKRGFTTEHRKVGLPVDYKRIQGHGSYKAGCVDYWAVSTRCGFSRESFRDLSRHVEREPYSCTSTHIRKRERLMTYFDYCCRYLRVSAKVSLIQIAISIGVPVGCK